MAGSEPLFSHLQMGTKRAPMAGVAVGLNALVAVMHPVVPSICLLL